MTRINAGFPVKKLTDKHLLAEHREIKRIPNTIKSGKAKFENIPQNFTLGAGHVKFFYDKLGYLKERYLEIHRECILRGFNVTNYTECWDGLPEKLMKNWTPSDFDSQLIVNRINERLSEMKK